MAKGAGGILKGLIYLVLIAFVLYGAKIFYFDPQKQQQIKSDATLEIDKHLDNNEWQKALDQADKVQNDYPKMKDFCDGRRFAIYEKKANHHHDMLIKIEGTPGYKSDPRKMTTLKKEAEALLATVAKLDEYGDLEKVHYNWLIAAYVTLGNRSKAQEIMKKKASM